MRDGPNLTRRADIRRALKRAKPDDMLTLEALALVWGTTKQRFVTVRNGMADFPQPQPGQGNVYIYPARKALEAMLGFETRHDTAAKARAARTNAILGRSRRGKVDDEAASHSVNELRTLNQMRAEIEQQERDQGLYARMEEVAAVAGEVFSEISEFMGGLSNKIDPHGLLAAEVRAQIDAGADEALLQFHRKMKDVLSPDAHQRGNRKAPGSARRARPRR